ncbi:MAG: OmpA family protein [Bacteroidetes bacterium]|nr:MAG: OmpA family protein [Bacteroidota bacterium]
MIKQLLHFPFLSQITKIIFFICCCITGKAQEFVKNPEFRDITISNSIERRIFPANWKSFNWPLPLFYYDETKLSSNIFDSNIMKPKGMISLRLIHPSEGILTELNQQLGTGKIYLLTINLKIIKLRLNSNSTELAYFRSDNKQLDSSKYDYNAIISLIIKLHYKVPDCQIHENDQLIILDFPENITPEFSELLTLTTKFRARGYEKYLSIGTCNTQDYLKILRQYKGDIANYDHKFAQYLISKVSIIPFQENPPRSITYYYNQFRSDSLDNLKNEISFVIHRISFAYDSCLLNNEAKEELIGLANYLKKDSTSHLEIFGYTDSVGSEKYNLLLSQKRAFNVFLFLKNHGLDSTRLSWGGRGEDYPIVSNDLNSDQSIYRRVEFKLIRK